MPAGERVRRLADLITGIPCEIRGKTDINIKGIACHSSQVKPGFLFVAIEGLTVSGRNFIDEAINRGAVAVATTDVREVKKTWVTAIQTQMPRRFLAQVANRFYDFPARRLNLIGVTGTNGKTSICYLLRSVCRQLGFEPGFIGTIEYWDGVERKPAGHTTPESLELVEMLSRMVESNVPVCISEVSSHALELDRVFDIDFKVAVFTNLTQDHLDFHRTMDNYRRAKMKLFESLTPTSWAVTNIDDPTGMMIPRLTKAKVIAYGTKRELEPFFTRERNVSAYIQGEVVRSDSSGLECRVQIIRTEEINFSGGGTASSLAFPVELRLVGRHHLMNLLATVGVAYAMGWGLPDVLTGVNKLEMVPGRLEKVNTGKLGFNLFVDYAHTPDALKQVLTTVHEFTHGRVIVVFGCGGDRDRTKRPLMGKIAAQLADVVIITSDNPRTEEPRVIIEEIIQGIPQEVRRSSHSERVIIVEEDREKAIRQAIISAQPGDTVVIAGKGHETYQIIGGEKRHFDDREVAKGIIEKIVKASSNSISI
ncbi:MAG: UDP-N-acetylmuramoyl-L-alanyl-D-glutamate--2,6-diaminopimelate ligase [candidate division WOR-3 bacterium]